MKVFQIRQSIAHFDQSKPLKIFKKYILLCTLLWYICPKLSTYIPPTLVVVVYSIVADKTILDCRLSVRKNNTDQSYASFHCGKNSKYSSKVIGLVHSQVFIPILRVLIFCIEFRELSHLTCD